VENWQPCYLCYFYSNIYLCSYILPDYRSLQIEWQNFGKIAILLKQALPIKFVFYKLRSLCMKTQSGSKRNCYKSSLCWLHGAIIMLLTNIYILASVKHIYSCIYSCTPIDCVTKVIVIPRLWALLYQNDIFSH